ncbi:TPA: hypothetical protein DCW38_01205 [candidate division WOR-3 bacterium]|jgi:hypothetical protein|uniref:Uncharacterized protein n=1 Tax=candidate division WOR-3 bacterium TaxID=2052148 RepID=A0A350H8B9_UNCW3|nr:hypothetical protein [candidate division WOR-3 bacterium]
MATTIGIWIAAGLTLFIYSFLYKDNPFYKFAEHLYVGITAGYWLIYTWAYTIQPMLLDPIIKNKEFILIIPAFFGVIMLTRWFPSISWLSRWSIAFTVGIGAGLGVTGSIQGFILPQLKSTILPLTGLNFATFNNLLIIFGVFTTLVYFYFSREHKGLLGHTAKVGMTFIMIAFGASFGYTVMARISLLIGRIYFLMFDWIGMMFGK